MVVVYWHSCGEDYFFFDCLTKLVGVVFKVWCVANVGYIHDYGDSWDHGLGEEYFFVAPGDYLLWGDVFVFFPVVWYLDAEYGWVGVIFYLYDVFHWFCYVFCVVAGWVVWFIVWR